MRQNYLESRMLENLHVRFGVGAGVKLPGLHHSAFWPWPKTRAANTIRQRFSHRPKPSRAVARREVPSMPLTLRPV